MDGDSSPSSAPPGERRFTLGGDDVRLAAWVRRTEWPLTGLAAVFLVAYAWQVLHVSPGPALSGALEVVLWVVWAVFAADYLVRLALAERKWRFVRSNVFDLLAVALPMFRQLRVLRLVSALLLVNRRASTVLRGRVGTYLAATTGLVAVTAALAVLDAERGAPEASIATFPDALWWTLTTISTVGYGDLYPVTPEGRLVAAALMVGGIALLGTISGMIASWLLERIQAAEPATDALRAENARLRQRLTDLGHPVDAREPDRPQ